MCPGLTATGPSLQASIAREHQASPSLDGCSVFGWEKDLAQAGRPGARELDEMAHEPNPAQPRRLVRLPSRLGEPTAGSHALGTQRSYPAAPTRGASLGYPLNGDIPRSRAAR